MKSSFFSNSFFFSFYILALVPSFHSFLSSHPPPFPIPSLGSQPCLVYQVKAGPSLSALYQGCASETTTLKAAHYVKEYILPDWSVIVCAAHRTGTKPSYLYCLQNRFVEIRKSGVVIHHTVHQLRYLH